MNSSSFWIKLFDKTANTAKQNIDNSIATYENQEEVNKTVERINDDMSRSFLIDLKKNINKILKDKQEEQSGFNERLYKLWEKPLNLLRVLLILSEEIGRYYNKRLRPQKSKENDIVFEALIRLHARSSLIGGEIYTLLCNGYAFGAMARWRSLYETAITIYFIAEHGNVVAEKYLLHEKIETYKSIIQYNDYDKKLNGVPFSEKEVKNVEKVKDELCKRYGKSFKNRYGWAAAELEKKDPTFKDIEKEIGLDYWQPYYKMASYSIHPNSKSLMFTLGLKNNKNIMLAGPSNADLEEPGCNTAISLCQINSVLLTREPDYLHLVVAKAMIYLSEEIQQSFLEVAKTLNNTLHFKY